MADVSDKQSTPLSDLPRLALDDEQPVGAEPAPTAAKLPETNGNPSAPDLAALEARVRRLEADLGALQNTRIIEERIVERLSKRMRRGPVTQVREAGDRPPELEAPAPPGPPAEGTAPPELAHAAAGGAPPNEAPPPAGGQFADLPPVRLGENLPHVVSPAAGPRTENIAAAPVATAVIAPVAQLAPLALVAPLAVAVPAAAVPLLAEPSRFGSRITWIKQSWLLVETLNELRIVLRMFTDPRYRLTWMGRVVPLLFLVIFFFSDWSSLQAFFPWNILPGGWILNKILMLVLGFVAYKVMMREVQRYKDTIPDAPGK